MIIYGGMFCCSPRVWHMFGEIGVARTLAHFVWFFCLFQSSFSTMSTVIDSIIQLAPTVVKPSMWYQQRKPTIGRGWVIETSTIHIRHYHLRCYVSVAVCCHCFGPYISLYSFDAKGSELTKMRHKPSPYLLPLTHFRAKHLSYPHHSPCSLDIHVSKVKNVITYGIVFLFQAANAYLRDQWLHSVQWKVRELIFVVFFFLPHVCLKW